MRRVEELRRLELFSNYFLNLMAFALYEQKGWKTTPETTLPYFHCPFRPALENAFFSDLRVKSKVSDFFDHR